jgi:hypothetical protein
VGRGSRARTYKSSAGARVTSRRSCPEQTADNEQDDDNERLARIDDRSSTHCVGGEGPEYDSEEIAAARRSISYAHIE